MFFGKSTFSPVFQVVQKNTWLRQLLLSAGIVLAAYFPLLMGQTLLFGDNYSLMVPGKLFTAHSILSGELPFWNPYIFAGIPWIGDINQSILYPSTLFFLLFSPAVALNSTVLLHLILTFFGMVRLALRFKTQQWTAFVAAVLWTFSPQMTGVINNISTLQSLSWMPWVVLGGLLLKERKGVLLFVFAVLAQFLGGYPQHVLYSILTAASFSAIQEFLGKAESAEHKLRLAGSWFLRWFAVGLVAIALTTVTWWPFLDVLAESTREIQTTAQAASGSLEFSELIKVVLPKIFDDPAAGMKWGPSWNKPPNVMLYFTWFGLFLGGLAVLQRKVTREQLSLLGVAIIGILLAMGDNLPTFSLLQAIPLLQSSRGLSTLLMIPALVIPLLIAQWVSTVSISKKATQLLVLLGLCVTAVTALMLVAVQQSFPEMWQFVDSTLGYALSNSAFHTIERNYSIAHILLTSTMLQTISFAAAIWLWQQRKFTAIVLVLAVDMVLMSRQHLFFAPSSVYTAQFERSEMVREAIDTTHYRVLTRNYNSPYTDFGAYWDAISVRAPFSDSYVDAEELKEFVHLQRMRDGATPNWNMVLGVPIINGYTTLLPLSMHRVFAEQSATASINNLPQIPISHTALADWSVGYYLVDTWFPEYDEPFPETILAEQEHWKLYQMDALPRFRTGNSQAVQITDFQETANTLRFRVFLPDDSGLLIADRYHAEWQAEANGQPVQIENRNDKRFLPLVAGEYVIEIEYVPTRLYQGAAVTTVATIGLLVWGFTGRTKNMFKMQTARKKVHSS